MAVHYSSKKTTHRTPLELVDSIERHFGAIALDPCAYRPIERQTVRARVAWCSGGLRRPWDVEGLIYVNPPYGKPIMRWVLHALEQRDLGREILLLVPGRVDTVWFNALLEAESGVLSGEQVLAAMMGHESHQLRRRHGVPWCAVRGRLKFHRERDSAPFPSALVYLGSRVDVFRAFAAEWGRCYLELRAPTSENAARALPSAARARQARAQPNPSALG